MEIIEIRVFPKNLFGSDGVSSDWSDLYWIIRDWTNKKSDRSQLLSFEEIVNFALKESTIHTIRQVFLNLFKDRKENEEQLKRLDKRMREKKAVSYEQWVKRTCLKREYALFLKRPIR